MSTDPEATPALPTSQTAEGGCSAREARYAEAERLAKYARKIYAAKNSGAPSVDAARAVMALADAEQAALVAERDAYRKAKQENDERFQIAADEQRIRAEAAEAERDALRATVKRVEAFADDLTQDEDFATAQVGSGQMVADVLREIITGPVPAPERCGDDALNCRACGTGEHAVPAPVITANAPFSRILREGGSPAPGDAEKYERALDDLFPEQTSEAAALRRIVALLAIRESNDVRDEDGFMVVRADDIRAMFPPHACEGDGTCIHCGADEPPQWPAGDPEAQAAHHPEDGA